ncbi:copper homeostasis protein CutC [Diaminobutyricibacter tongyongensis]|uniref:PF03932 family protein CutC n=1 Tax=Leifsonia tongyongensis TaxID=1268043 RepID=A0A6L9XZX5_9MICO|nr:copper homeostasis protein CutC [Diaminobutyricibacter tongyongensis]
MGRRVAVEIAVQDPAGVRTALAAGADRIELCSALGVGGLTPSAGMIATAVAAARAAGRPGFVHVLVRPRAGGFVYDDDEIGLTVADVIAARQAGASGVVVGALNASGGVDRGAMEALVAVAGPLEVTFHRALDVVEDPLATVETLIDLGVTRILTSGAAPRSIEGTETLAALVERASGRIQIMAGGGVSVADIARLAAAGVDAVHLSARSTVTGPPSGPGGGDSTYDVTDADIAEAAVAAVRAL